MNFVDHCRKICAHQLSLFYHEGERKIGTYEDYHTGDISTYHRITECSGLKGTSVGHLVQAHCQSRVSYSRLHRTSSRRVLNISREGDSTTSLGSLFQCSVTLRGKKFILIFSWSFLCFSLCPLPLVLLLGTTEQSLAPSS